MKFNSNPMYKAPFEGRGKRYLKRSFRSYYGRPGIYIIACGSTNRILYVGMSKSNVVESLYRHFYPWSPHARQPVNKRVTYLDHETKPYLCQIIECRRDEVIQIERALIVSLSPRDNTEKYETYFQTLAESAPVDVVDDLPF